MRDRSSSRAVGRVHVGDAGWVRPTPGPVVARIRPKLAGLGAAAARIEQQAPSPVASATQPGKPVEGDPIGDLMKVLGLNRDSEG